MLPNNFNSLFFFNKDFPDLGYKTILFFLLKIIFSTPSNTISLFKMSYTRLFELGDKELKVYSSKSDFLI